MEINEAVKEWRKRTGLTQQEVADKIEMAQPQYARFESGKFGFKAEHIKAIAIAYKVSADILLGIVKYDS